MLDVDVGGHAAHLLRLGDDVLTEGRFAGRFRTVQLRDAAARHAADAEGDVEGQRARGDSLDLEVVLLAEAHDGAASELLFNRPDGEVNCAGTLVGQCHCHLFESPFILRLRGSSP